MNLFGRANRHRLAPYLKGIGFLSASFVFALAIWGMVFADAENSKIMKFALCHQGTQAGVSFSNARKVFFGHHRWGPETFKMEFWALSVPGATAFLIKAPICPDDDVDEFIGQRSAEELRAASDTNGVQNALRQGYDDAESERTTRGTVPYETTLDDGYRG